MDARPKVSPRMKPVLLSYSDLSGGAGRAAYRLHRGLIDLGVTSRMVVQDKASRDSTVFGPDSLSRRVFSKLRPILDSRPLNRYPRDPGVMFSPAIVPGLLSRTLAELQPDVIHLHWVNNGYLRPETFRSFTQPLVWTLHDMWAFTGGCHYDQGCGAYRQACGKCPILGAEYESDLSRSTWRRKYQAWKRVPITIVTPSRWLAKCAAESSLMSNLPIEVIPNGLDVTIFKPVPKPVARELLNLPRDKKLLLFGAKSAVVDSRKGFDLLVGALRVIAGTELRDQLELVIFGNEPGDEISHLGLPVHCLGSFHDELSLSVVYSAADLFIAPSTQDNLPNTVMEAMACGTANIAFDIGGMRDMIEHGSNGYLARPFDVEDLARGIRHFVEDPRRLTEASGQAREKVEREYSVELMARRYADLYESTRLVAAR